MGSDIHVSMRYLARLPLYQKEKPFELWMPSDDGMPRTNCQFQEEFDIPLADARFSKEELNLGTSGFQFVRHTSQCMPATDKLAKGSKDAVTPYLRETISLVQSHVPAEKLFCFDWRYRKGTEKAGVEHHDANGPPDDRYVALGPASVVHQDESQVGGEKQIELHMTADELREYHQGYWRIRFINVWRPLIAAVEDAPLAVCDARSVHKNDLEACDTIETTHAGEGNYVYPNKDHRWYWFSCQTCDEPVLFVTWDSDAAFESTVCPPHASFKNPVASPCAPTRESIEVRVMVFSRNKREELSN